MDIKIFARGPGQEYSTVPGQPGQHLYKWSSRYMGPSSKERMCLFTRDCLAVRRDSQTYGFVHNLQNDLIFYADSEALALIENWLDQPVTALQESKPWLFDALSITLPH